MRLDRIAANLHEAIGNVRFRHRSGALGFVRDFVQSVGRIPVECTRRFDIERHVRELVLERLEVADRHSKLLARLRVLDGHLHQTRGTAEGVSGQQNQTEVPSSRRGIAREDLTRSLVESQVCQTSRPVRIVHSFGTDTRTGLDNCESAVRRTDDDHIGLGTEEHRLLPTAERTTGSVERPVLGLPSRTLAKGDGAEGITRREARKPLLLLRIASTGRDGEACQRVAQEWTGRGAETERLGNDGEVERREPRTAVLFGNRDPRQTEFDKPLPE